MLNRFTQFNICCLITSGCCIKKEAVILFTLEGAMIKNHHLHRHQIHQIYR